MAQQFAGFDIELGGGFDHSFIDKMQIAFLERADERLVVEPKLGNAVWLRTLYLNCI